ncbi:tripartite motif-containing protein 2-like [Ptychodera flava]|uniref:tripartite motif-containing protein 2-like n=1 Tax=Ptychodera flava TaxID=63121 RepID=UPI00396A09A7
MATKDPQLPDEIDEHFLMCSLCSERYKTAKLLPCLHSFCESCLAKLAEKTQEIICPTCRRSHEVPSCGVSGITDNSFVNDMIEAFYRESKEYKCEGCDQGERVKHCVECDVDLCSNCSLAHGRLRTSRSHRLLTLEEYLTTKFDNPASVQPPSYCTVHTINPIEYFCDTCSLTLCVKCAALGHPKPGHNWRCLDDAAADYSEKLGDSIDEVKAKETEISQSITSVRKMSESLDRCYQIQNQEIRQHIQQTLEVTTQLIQENGDKVLAELKDEYNRRKENLNAQLKELEIAESDYGSAREYAETLVHYGNSTQLMTSKKGIDSKMVELLNRQTKVDPSETGFMKFERSDDICKARTLNLVGNLRTETEFHFSHIPEFARLHEDFTFTLATRDDDANITETVPAGVVVMPDGSQEDITSTSNGDGTWNLNIRAKMTGDHEVSVCASKKPVIGSPITMKVIQQKGLICRFGGNGSDEGKFKKPYGVVLSGDGGVRVCDSDNHRLQTFTLDGKHRSTTKFSNINISSGIYPRFSAVSNEGVVFTTDSKGGQVLVHDEDGRVIQSFGKGMMTMPFGIAINPVNGRVYVADRDGSCIHIYTQHGKHCRSFGKQGLGHLACPLDLAIGIQGRVFVSDRKNNGIKVYDSQGEYLYSFGEDRVTLPAGIALDVTGNVYVCVRGTSSCVLKYESSGKLVCRIDSVNERAEMPTGICITNDQPYGNVIVVNKENGCVQIFSQ